MCLSTLLLFCLFQDAESDGLFSRSTKRCIERYCGPAPILAGSRGKQTSSTNLRVSYYYYPYKRSEVRGRVRLKTPKLFNGSTESIGVIEYCTLCTGARVSTYGFQSEIRRSNTSTSTGTTITARRLRTTR
jgi:hypothetical protein